MNITVSISSYNQSEYIADAIESVLNQGFMVGDLQLIVVDDGSTDNSLEIVKKCWSNWVTDKNAGKTVAVEDFIIISQTNRGLPSARNTGLMNATGDWFLPLDADDILLETCVHRIWEKINDFFPPDIIGLSFKEFGIRSTVIKLMPKPTLADFKIANRIGYCSAIKTSVLKEVGGYSPRMVFGYEDYALWFDLLKRGKTIITISDILWLYRTKPNSMIHDAQKHHVELMTQICKDFPDIFPELVELKNPLPK